MKFLGIIIFFIICSLSIFAVFASDVKSEMTSGLVPVPDKMENKLSEQKICRLNQRVEEILKMNKSKMSVTEKLELEKELLN